jgi:hypothetical protein
MALRRGVFYSVRDLQHAVLEFLTVWNAAPAPFVWTADVDSIPDTIARTCKRLEQIEPGSTLPKRRLSATFTRR